MFENQWFVTLDDKPIMPPVIEKIPDDKLDLSPSEVFSDVYDVFLKFTKLYGCDRVKLVKIVVSKLLSDDGQESK